MRTNAALAGICLAVLTALSWHAAGRRTRLTPEATAVAGARARTGPARYVNPMIGTKGGETWPGADLPFGMVQWSPENTSGKQSRTTSPGGYSYAKTRIRGFSLTHMSGTGCAGTASTPPASPIRRSW